MHADHIPLPGAGAGDRRAFSYLHTVTLEETNQVGNVYFARHVAWQGRCRELFLQAHAPEVLKEMFLGLRIITLSASCEYFEEIRAFDTIQILMRLSEVKQNRIALDFEYRRVGDHEPQVVASGRQELACLNVTAAGAVPVPPPPSLRDAMARF